MSDDRFARLPPGPVLVIADNEAIASGGPRWADLFAVAGRHYRVRLAGPSRPETIASEAEGLSAVAIVWIGSRETHALAEAVATRLAIPLFDEAILNHASLSY